MKQRSGEVAVRHLQPIVDSPERRCETIADAWEATTRRRVRLEHHEFLPELLGDAGRVQIRPHEVLPRGVGEVVREHVLGVLNGSEPSLRELGCAVLVGIAREYGQTV